MQVGLTGAGRACVLGPPGSHYRWAAWLLSTYALTCPQDARRRIGPWLCHTPTGQPPATIGRAVTRSQLTDLLGGPTATRLSLNTHRLFHSVQRHPPSGPLATLAPLAFHIDPPSHWGPTTADADVIDTATTLFVELRGPGDRLAATARQAAEIVGAAADAQLPIRT